jgi:phage-related protein
MVKATTITVFDVLVFIVGLVLGVALGALTKRSVGLLILILLFVGVAVYYGYLNTASINFTSIIQVIWDAIWAVIQFIASGLSVLSGNITPESMFSFGTLLGFVVGLSFPRVIRPVRAVDIGTGRYVRKVEEERKRYVKEVED